MMGIGFTEMIVIAGIALVVIGPEKFPDFAKLVIRTIRDLRGYMDEMKAEVAKELRPLKKEMDALSKIDPEKYIDSLTADAPEKPTVSPNLPVSPEDQKVMAEAQSFGDDAYPWRGGEEGLNAGPESSVAPEGTVGYGDSESPALEGDDTAAVEVTVESTGESGAESEDPDMESLGRRDEANNTGEPDVWTGR
jgi:sec-independent protein translocase protein TatB